MKNLEKKSIRNLEELRSVAERIVDLIGKLGLNCTLADAFEEMRLILNIVKALHEYTCFKEQQLER